MKRLMTGIMLLAVMVGTLACSAPSRAPVPATSFPEDGKVVPAPGVPPPVINIPPQPAPTAIPRPTPTPAPAPGFGAVQPSDDRMIVRTGNMQLVVEDVLVSIDRITQLAQSAQGYVVASSSWKEGERLRGTITIRVPAGRFDDITRQLAAMAVEVTSNTTSSQDVTQEYTDLGTRLKNLEATEQQLLRIMEKAEKVEDILRVQSELTRTRGEIEQIKGRMLYLERTSATSLIEVNLYQAKLEVKFTANRVVVKAGEEIRFAVQLAGGFSPYSYLWDFGDKSTSTAVSPSHSYSSPGSYTVSVKVTDDRGNTDTETRPDYVSVLPGWEPGSIASGAWNGLVVFGQVLANILIWLAIFSPVWLVAGGITYLVWRKKKARKGGA